MYNKNYKLKHVLKGIELLFRNRLRTPLLTNVPSISINGQIEKLQVDFGQRICSNVDLSTLLQRHQMELN
ncbi:unnamed protein product [Paramecium sonneborni]|uniref:Uncharacterized protein n=1 Tax=Paramecium sonneborni TaxID=65129 RepID=A0A8S1N7X6_9CILI|nr:unnamed protein product [Paramecium sonneborni]